MPLQEEYLDNLLKGIAGETSGDTKEEEIVPTANSMADIESMMERAVDEAMESMAESAVGEETGTENAAGEDDILGETDVDLNKLLQGDDTVSEEMTSNETVQTEEAADEEFKDETAQAGTAAEEAPWNETVQTEEAVDEEFRDETAQAGTAAEEAPWNETVQTEEAVDEEFRDETVAEDEVMEDETGREITAEDTLTVEEASGLSEKEIEQLLMAGQSASEQEPGIENGMDDDLMKLLEDTPDTELNEIHDILQKADNNEAVDESVLAAGETEEEVFDPLADDEGSSGEELSEKEQKAQEKKRLKEQKKAAKAQKREEKKALSAAKKEERKAARALKKGNNPTEENLTEKDGDMSPAPLKEDEMVAEDDFSVLDNIIESAEGYPDVETLGLDGNSQESAAGEAAADDVIDMESLFSTDGVDDDNILGLLQFAESLGDDSDFSLGNETDTNTEPAREKQAEEKNVSPKEGKKKGFFARVLDFLTEEEEEETDEDAEIQLSDENKNILNELDKEKGKKGKKKKGKKGKKGEEAGSAEGEEAEGAEDGEKGGKKEKKPKKVKMPKKVREPLDNGAASGKKLSFKKILPILLICVTLGVAIFIMTSLAGDYSVKKAGREAYYNGDYQSCYENLYGRDLTESEQVMYSKSESILCIRLWFREYELFVEEGLELQALDSLLQSVQDYPKLYDYASQWNAGNEVSQTYQQILDTLSNKYQLSEAQAKELMAVEDDREYTRRVNMIVQGKGYGAWDTPVETKMPQAEDTLEDMLLEEEDLEDVQFIDNN